MGWRKIITRLVLTVVLVSTTLAQGAADPVEVVAVTEAAQESPTPPLAAMEVLLSMPLPEFLEHKMEELGRGSGTFDWSSDGCTSPVPDPPAILQTWIETFAPACERHDWGYRNFGSINRRGYDPTEARRREVDEQLRTDMNSICAEVPTQSLRCRIMAEVVYRAVRLGGQLAFYGFFESAESGPDHASEATLGRL